MEISFKKASKDDFASIAAMGRSVWMETYPPIIGIAQTEYMIEKFQSEEAIIRQTGHENYEYYLIMADSERAGYAGIQPYNGLYLSKLYILKKYRRLGIGRKALEFLKGICSERGLGRIWLTVNRHNAQAIRSYLSWGMSVEKEMVSDIGNGFVMDDFVFEVKAK